MRFKTPNIAIYKNATEKRGLFGMLSKPNGPLTSR